MDDGEIREALNECVVAVVSAIRVAPERTPPELSADTSDRGIVLAGDGALLQQSFAGYIHFESPSLEFSAKHDPIMVSKQVGDSEDQISGRRPKTNVHYRCEELFLLFPLPLSLAVQPSSTRVRG